MPLGPGPQYAPADCVFWSTADGYAWWEQTARGTNCIVVGTPTYPADGVFEGCTRTNLHFEGWESYAHGGTQIFNAGTLELWIRPQGWNIVNGVPTMPPTDISAQIYINLSGLNSFNVNFTTAAPGGVRWVVRNAGGVTMPFIINPVPGLTLNSGNWGHVAFVWDATGIAGSANTRRIYFNNALCWSSNNALLVPVYGGIETQSYLYSFFAPNQPFDGDGDNFRIYNTARTDFTESMSQEHFTPPTVSAPRPPDLFDIRAPRIEVMGQDLTCVLRQTPKLIEKRGLGTDLVFPSDCKLVCENFDNAFSLEHPSSLFAGTKWQNDPVQIWDREGMQIWDGVLAAPQVDHAKRVTTLISRSRLHQWRDETVVYTSGAAETPAAALENIAAAIGFTDLDTAFLQQSKDRQTADGVSLTVTLVAADNATFSQVLNKLADYGAADVYEHLGKLRYVYFSDAPSRPSVTLAEDDLISIPKVTRTTQDFVNDYAIWDSAATRTDAGNGNIGANSRLQNSTFLLSRVPGSADAKYVITNQAAAVAIGEAYIRRSHMDLSTAPRPRIQVQFDLEVHHRVWVDLREDFALSYSREGWTAKPFRTVAFERDDTKGRIRITGLEWT